MRMLVKGFHSLIYVFMSFCVLYLVYGGITGTRNLFLWIAIGLIIGETLVLLANGRQCPLKTMALQMGDESGDDLIADWLLPKWAVPLTVPTCSALAIFGLVLVVVNLIVGRGA